MHSEKDKKLTTETSVYVAVKISRGSTNVKQSVPKWKVLDKIRIK
jgi:hypothetical protein